MKRFLFILTMIFGLIMISYGILLLTKQDSTNYKYKKINTYQIKTGKVIEFPIFENMKSIFESQKNIILFTNDNKRQIKASSIETDDYSKTLKEVLKDIKDGNNLDREEKLSITKKNIDVYKFSNKQTVIVLFIFKNNEKELNRLEYVFSENINDNLIKELLNNIKIKNNPIYTNGTIKNDVLSISLQVKNEYKNYELLVEVDNKKYKELKENNNDFNLTTIINKKTNKVSILNLIYIYSELLDNNINEYMGFDPNQKFDNVSINSYTYQYAKIDNKHVYLLKLDNTLYLKLTLDDKDDINNYKVIKAK